MAGHGSTLDRLNGRKGYAPANVRWATKMQQSQNARSVWLLTADGEKIGVQEMARRLAMKPATLYRVFAGLRGGRP
jgi:hypothetical protein